MSRGWRSSPEGLRCGCHAAALVTGSPEGLRYECHAAALVTGSPEGLRYECQAVPLDTGSPEGLRYECHAAPLVTGSPEGLRYSRHAATVVAQPFRAAVLAALLLCIPALAEAQAVQYERPVQTAPQQETIGGGYVTPQVQRPQPRHYWLEIADVLVLAGAMSLAVWLVVRRRSRPLALTLSIGSLAYFGFYREGCVCPVGSIQNVAVALTDPGYSIPIVVTAVFFLPLIVAVFFGRAFCGGVCALGAIQELVLLKPVQVPRRLDRALGLLKYVYLGVAIVLAVQPAISRDFVICRFDPFVGFFRRDGFAHMMAIGSGFLVLGMFVGRPYCRYLCPYGGLLTWCSRLATRGVTISPGKELDCGLCATACPYGAIDKNRAVRKDCLYCARCYRACPCETQVGVPV